MVVGNVFIIAKSMLLLTHVEYYGIIFLWISRPVSSVKLPRDRQRCCLSRGFFD